MPRGGITLEKIALITDSSCDLTQDIIEKYNIKMLHLKIIYKTKEFIDRVTITPDEVYNNLKNEIPTTSLPSLDEIDALYTQLENEGYTHIIAITLSSGLSGTFNAMKLISEEHTNLKITVFDSKSLTIGCGALVMACGELIKKGKSFDDIISLLPKMKEKIKVFYVIDTLEYLIKGGRIGKVSGTIGKLLHLKPIISINEDGVYYTHSKARGSKQAFSKLSEIAKNMLETTKSSVWVMHGGALEQGKAFYDKIASLPNLVSINFGDISPALGVHTGPGLLGLIVIEEPLI